MNKNIVTSRGFTLIEMIIVVAIISILAMIVIPSLNNETTRSRRNDAKVALTRAATDLERCFVMYNAYNNSACNAYPASGTVVSDNGYYKIIATSLSATAFTLTASPTASSPQQDDTHCQNLSITSGGVKSATHDDCW